MAEKKVMVEMTTEAAAQLEAFRAEKAKKESEEKQQKEMVRYRATVDKLIDKAVRKCRKASETLQQTKAEVMDMFKDAIDKKEELLNAKGDRRSNTFTNTKGTARIELGYRIRDNFNDTVNEGVNIVNAYIDSLAVDDATAQLVNMLKTLLNDRWKNGQLKAENVLRLRNEADRSTSEEFKRGVKLISEAYQPLRSKDYIRVEVRDEESGAWTVIPLNATNC